MAPRAARDRGKRLGLGGGRFGLATTGSACVGLDFCFLHCGLKFGLRFVPFFDCRFVSLGYRRDVVCADRLGRQGGGQRVFERLRIGRLGLGHVTGCAICVFVPMRRRGAIGRAGVRFEPSSSVMALVAFAPSG